MNKDTLASNSIEQVLASLGCKETGLTTSEAQIRLAKYGPNLIKNEQKLHGLKILLNQFRSSLIYLLLTACLIAFLLKDWNDGIVIAIILFINTGLGFFQEYRSEKAVENLQKLVAKETLVHRDGQDILVSEKLIVPGDIIILKEGDIAPSDIKLLKVEDLSIDESQLTGESLPVSKSLNGQNSVVYAGSVIEQGEARGIVAATGSHTELGRIAHLSDTTKRVTQFEKSLSSFSNFLVRVTFITLLAVFVLKLILVHDHSHIGTLLLFIIALSIAVVPEAMPVIITVTLSRGALNLTKRHVIAKTITAVEDIGNINVLCSDKTGTLTENKQTIKSLIAEDKQFFQTLAIIGLETFDLKHRKLQSSFDQAFIDYVPANIKAVAAKFDRLEELPFDPDSRRRRVVASDGQDTYLIEIGSVETLLKLTREKNTQKYQETIKSDGAMGLRHLGIAYKKIKYTASKEFDILKHEDGLKFAGFVSLEDPLRPSAKHTISLAQKLGVAIKILSGDSREVTEYVASQVGLLKKGQLVYTGDEIEQMPDHKLSQIVQDNSTFARLNPEQKYRIINLLKLRGNVVGYQGDGINDAPALKLADVAIAVSHATDVAQESADILLLRSDIGVIVNGIKFGREIFANINKYIRYTFVNGWGTFFALSALYLLSVKSLPVLPVQLLLTNLLTDLPCVTIATDNADTKELHRPSKFNVHALMFVSMFLGVITAVFEIMYFAIIKSYKPSVASTGMYLFLTFTALIVIFSIRNQDHFWHAPKMSSVMKWAFGIITVLSIGVVYLPGVKGLLAFSALSPKLLGITILLTVIYFMLLDIVKVWFYRSNLESKI